MMTPDTPDHSLDAHGEADGDPSFIPSTIGLAVALAAQGDTSLIEKLDAEARAAGYSNILAHGQSLAARQRRDTGSMPDNTGDLIWLRDQIFALCEDTEDKCATAIDRGGHGDHALGFYRGQLHEAKGIRGTIANVVRDRLAGLAAASPTPAVAGAVETIDVPEGFYVSRDPDIRGGEPCIAGHRIPIAQMLAELSERPTINHFADNYSLDPMKVRGALATIANDPSVLLPLKAAPPPSSDPDLERLRALSASDAVDTIAAIISDKLTMGNFEEVAAEIVNVFRKGRLSAPPAAQAGDAWEDISQAARDVLAERKRQIEAEGWTPEHDDAHDCRELATAAACYATAPLPYREEREWVFPGRPKSWPWHATWWKPGFYRRNLVKAAALILAEIERWDRRPAPPAVAETEARS